MLQSLLSPQSVAVIGASRSPGKVGNQVLSNLIRSGFGGDIVPVNPSAPEIMGRACFPSLKAWGKPVEMAIVAVPRKGVKAALEDATSAGVKAVILITAGFKEVSREGAQLEAELAAYCQARGVRLLGPNCLGLINTQHKMDASFGNKWPVEGVISCVSQSGALMSAILDYACQRGMGLSKLISIGNKADVNENDLLKALAEDPHTRVIVGYLESISDGKEFMRIAEAAASSKPVVIFKSGVTQAGKKAASSHTGSLAGADMAYGAAFRRSGVIRADTFEAMIDFAMAFATQPLPRGNRVAVVTNAGGPGIMAADAIEQSGLAMSPLTGGGCVELKKRLPEAASVSNPIDVLGDADAARYALAVQAAREDDSVDAILVLLTPQAVSEPLATAHAITACGGEKPILVSFMGGADVSEARQALLDAGLPDYPSPERAVEALKALYDYSAWLRRPQRIVTRFPVNRRRVRRIIHRHQRLEQYQVGEAQAKAILKAYDFNVPDGAVATSSREAVAFAEKIGYPVAMKIVSPDVIHKSDMGGVRLNLNSRRDIEDAFDLMMLRIAQRVPDARIEGVYIEEMCGRGREVILGMSRDPQFGPMLMFGLGGIFVEVMKDVTFHIAPITEGEAMQMLESTKSFDLLKGVRGQTSVDIPAIAVSLQRISQLVTDFRDIVEMDINPFIVGEVGSESVAADARITLASPRMEQ